MSPSPDRDCRTIAGRVAVVGVCAAGKSTLVQHLRSLGYDAHHCAQEHSYVPDMWQQLVRPELLVYLDVSLQCLCKRRSSNIGADDLAEQHRRLSHARAHCDLYVDTTCLDPQSVCSSIIAALEARCIRRTLVAPLNSL